jgi:peroxiredoxin
VRRFRERHDLSYPLLVDRSGASAKQLQIEGIPTNVIADRRGIIREIGGSTPVLKSCH